MFGLLHCLKIFLKTPSKRSEFVPEIENLLRRMRAEKFRFLFMFWYQATSASKMKAGMFRFGDETWIQLPGWSLTSYTDQLEIKDSNQCK